LSSKIMYRTRFSKFKSRLYNWVSVSFLNRSEVKLTKTVKRINRIFKEMIIVILVNFTGKEF
jgi:hypothetical protein